MMRHSLSRWLGRLLAALFVVAGLWSSALAADSDLAGLGVSLASDKSIYAHGAPVVLAFEAINRSAAPVTLDFASAQRFDVALFDEAGREVWRWSAGRMFGQALGQETLGPDRPRLAYVATFSGRLKPGSYRARAWLTDRSGNYSATLGVRVR